MTNLNYLKKIDKSEHIFVEEHPYKVGFLSRMKITVYLIFLFLKCQTKANIERIKVDKTKTSRRDIKDWINALTIVFKPRTIS